jgi:hypothetical protein
MSAPADRTSFPRRSLQLDGIASGLCGVLLLAAASPIAPVIGRADPWAALIGNLAVAAVLLFAVLEVVGLTRLREATG